MSRPKPKWLKKAQQKRMPQEVCDTLRVANAWRHVRGMFGVSLFASGDGVDLEEITRMQAQMHETAERPYRALISKAGFDPDKDILILPKDLEGLPLTEADLPPGMRDRIKLVPVALCEEAYVIKVHAPIYPWGIVE